MKKRLAIIAVAVFCFVASMSAALTQKQKQSVVSAINKSVAELSTMNCSFTQTKYLSLLNNRMVSEGKMYFKQPQKLRWEYTTPYQYLFIFNGREAYIANKSRRDVIDTQSNRMFKEIARIMMSTVTGTALTNTTDFGVDVEDGNGVWNVTLVPKKKELKKMFTRIQLSFAKDDYLISEINLFEKNSDRTNIKLKNITVNRPVNETLFAIPK